MKYLLWILVAGSLFACTEPAKTADPIEQLKQETIAIHDEIMPLMGKMKQLQTQLNAGKAALVESGAYTEQQITSMVRNLGNADQDMMQWMRDYGEQIVRVEGGATIENLTKFKAAIAEIKVETFTAIEDAQSALEALKS